MHHLQNKKSYLVISVKILDYDINFLLYEDVLKKIDIHKLLVKLFDHW